MDEKVTRERIEEALRKGFRDNKLTVSECKLEPATQPGDNYLSYMTRASCRIQTSDQDRALSIIIKTLPLKSPIMLKLINELACFTVEAHLLGNVLPEIHDILDATGTNTRLSAQLYFAEVDTSGNTIMMEDLCEDGFQASNRCEGLNAAQCLKVVEALAAFHVASKVALRRNPQLKGDISAGSWGQANSGNTEQFLIDSYNKVFETIDSWSDVKWSDELKSYKKNIPKIIYDVFDSEEHKMPHVLNHGDAWTNNIMFKCTGDNQYEVRFVDFQFSSIRSPMIDIIYFIFTSPSNDIRFQILDDLLETYHKQWCHISALIGEYTDITIDDVKEEFKRLLAYGFGIMYSMYPVLSAPKENAPDLTKEMGDLEYKTHQREGVRRALLAGLKYLKEEGLFS